MFTNTGTVNVNEGTLSVSGPFTNYDAATDTITGGTYNVTSNFRFTQRRHQHQPGQHHARTAPHRK